MNVPRTPRELADAEYRSMGRGGRCVDSAVLDHGRVTVVVLEMEPHKTEHPIIETRVVIECANGSTSSIIADARRTT